MLTASLGHLVSAQSLSHSWPFATPCSPPGFCPWDFPSKNTEGGCHCLLQGWFHPRDGTQVSRIASGFFTTKAIWEAHRTFSTNCKPYCLFSKFNSVLNYHLSFDPRPFWPCIPSPTKSFFFPPSWLTGLHSPITLLCPAFAQWSCYVWQLPVSPAFWLSIRYSHCGDQAENQRIHGESGGGIFSLLPPPWLAHVGLAVAASLLDHRSPEHFFLYKPSHTGSLTLLPPLAASDRGVVIAVHHF